MILCVKHRGPNWRNVTHEPCVLGTNAKRLQRTVENLPNAIILAKLFRMGLLEKSHYTAWLCTQSDKCVKLNVLSKAVVWSFSCPAESKSISCEEMSPLQLSSCGHFIPDHYDTKLPGSTTNLKFNTLVIFSANIKEELLRRVLGVFLDLLGVFKWLQLVLS